MTTRPVGPLKVAGQVIDDPFAELEKYATWNDRTITRYDLPGPGDPGRLALAEVERTKVIHSRIGGTEADWFVATAGTAPWAAVPGDAMLADADPAEAGGLYDAATELYDWFRGRRGVSTAKISKVLHIKRPALVPILDSRLLKMYRVNATEAGRRHAEHARGAKRMYSAAIRDDLLEPGNVKVLAACRDQIEGSDAEQVQRLAGLSDVRLLDIVAWRMG